MLDTLTERGVACIVLVALIAHGLLSRFFGAADRREDESEERDSW